MLTFSYIANQNGSIRYHDGFHKNNRYIPQLLPSVYFLDSERNLEKVQHNLLSFTEDDLLNQMRMDCCLFDPMKKCTHCFSCIGLLNRKTPEELNAFETEKLLEKLDGLKEGDVLVMAGSLPRTMPDSIYSDILRRLDGKGILTVVDATGELLLHVLEYSPFLIKPNNHELGEIFQVKLETREDVVPYARKLQEKGARNVLVSMAGQGAVLLDEMGQVHMLPAPKGKLVNAVGAGDSMVAGFLAGWLTKKDYEYAFRMGISAGSASAFSENLATKKEIEEVYRQVSQSA